MDKLTYEELELELRRQKAEIEKLRLENSQLGDISLKKGTAANIEDYQNQLETLVAERTKELRKTNDALRSEMKERVKFELDYKVTKKWLNDIINTVNSALIAVDTEETITEWNETAEKITNINRQQALGKALSELLPAIRDYKETIETVLRGRPIKRLEKLPLDFGSQTVLSDLTVIPVGSEDIIGAIIQIDDITERNRMTEMMIQSEKMLSLGGLAAGMAHEINSPLASIVQSIQVVLKRTAEEIPKNAETAVACGTDIGQIREYMLRRDVIKMLNSIMDASKRAAEIVNNMLSFSRKGTSEKWPESLTDLLDQTLELASSEYDLKKKYDFRHIKIIREYAPDFPPVLCERSKIQQVFFNILKNGSQAMSEKTYDSDVKPTLTLRAYSNDSEVCIEIEDNGPGIAEPTKSQIFDPFFSTKEGTFGTGLGLSVSHYIITENHQGKITVDSNPGEGARFKIRLPINNPSRTV